MTDADKISTFYDREATKLCASYETLNPAALYPEALGLLPSSPASVLDVAAGSGRDAAWLADMGHKVTAVEPSAAMRREAMSAHGENGVEWIDDSLPFLSRVPRPRGGYSFILVAAVWMHLDPGQRTIAWSRLAELCAVGGSVLVTLRHGPSDEERPMKPICEDLEIKAARASGFYKAWLLPSGEDLLGRSAVRWSQLAAVR